MSAILRHPLTHTLTLLSGIAASTYTIRSQQLTHLEENEARMDELEGTLRGHIGYIEEALDRLEGKGGAYGSKMNEIYEKRGRDEKKKD